MSILRIKTKYYLQVQFDDGSWSYEYEKPDEEPFLKFVEQQCKRLSKDENKNCNKFIYYEKIFQQVEEGRECRTYYTDKIDVKEFVIKNLENFEFEKIEENVMEM